MAGPVRHGVPLSRRARGGHRNERLPFAPPENWYEPREDGSAYRFVIQDPGPEYRHVVTPQEVRDRLAQLPASFIKPLEVVQFSCITRKKTKLPLLWDAMGDDAVPVPDRKGTGRIL